jgi:hypothetical protein
MTLGAHDLTSRARLKLLLRDHTQPRTLSMSAGSRRGGTTGVRTVRARSGSSRLQRSNAGRRRERSRRPTGTPRSRLQGLGGAPCATPALHTALSASTSGVLPGLAPRDEAGRLPSAPTCPAPPATVLSSEKWVHPRGSPASRVASARDPDGSAPPAARRDAARTLRPLLNCLPRTRWSPQRAGVGEGVAGGPMRAVSPEYLGHSHFPKRGWGARRRLGLGA